MHTINPVEAMRHLGEGDSETTLASLNGSNLKLTRFKGEFARNGNGEADELFYVVSGRLGLFFDDRAEVVEEGEFIVVAAGDDYRAVCNQETCVVMIQAD